VAPRYSSLHCVALHSKPEGRQVSALIYATGDRVEDVFNSFTLSDTDAGKFNTVLAKFDAHFIVRRNTIFERAQFNRRHQQPGESASTFITAVFKLAETCKYGDLRDQLIRDRLVVGIADIQLSERLQLDDKLTLEIAAMLRVDRANVERVNFWVVALLLVSLQ
jgi:hypothetical protein